jgi:hypothetical protein
MPVIRPFTFFQQQLETAPCYSSALNKLGLTDAVAWAGAPVQAVSVLREKSENMLKEQVMTQQ